MKKVPGVVNLERDIDIVDAEVDGLRADFETMLDLTRESDSGSVTCDGSEQTVYEETFTKPSLFYGGFIDFTGANAGAGEDTTVKVYAKIKAGGNYIMMYTATYLAAAVPTSPLVRVPNNDDGQDIKMPFANVYSIKVTVTQAAVGGGWNTLDHEWFVARS